MKITHLLLIVALISLVGCIVQAPQELTDTNQTGNVTIEPPKETPKEDIQTPDAPKETTESPKEATKATGADPSLPRKEIREGELVSFPNLKAVDPDGDPITYTFTSPLDNKGEWQTKTGDAGEYLITITASDGTNTASQDLVLVVKPANLPPVISLPSKLNFKEGEKVILKPEITDADGDKVTVKYFGWMNSDTKEVGYDDSGTYKVTIEANDGKDKTTQEVSIVIEDVNRKPVITALEPIEIREGDEVKLRPKAKDPDGDTVTFTFAEPLDQTGSWRTKVGDAGEYSVTVTANDGKTTVQEKQIIIVEALNKAPTIEIAPEFHYREGETVKLNPVVTDPEGEDFTVEYSGWMTTSTKVLGYEDAGQHKVTITATDHTGHTRTKEVTVIVEDVNRAPEFNSGSFL